MKVVIIGGVAGGASAAARLRRLGEEAEIMVFERGEYISYANCGLPYHVGGVIEERDELLLMTPPPKQTSPSYSTADCPGVTAHCGSLKTSWALGAAVSEACQCRAQALSAWR